MNYTIVVGLEVHVQLLTNSKLFCGCANKFNPENPNVQTCPVCLGLPGSLPVMNRKAFELSIRTGLALNCEIARFTKWDRKQYFYPDLPKAYQISQYDLPLSHEGYLDIETESGGPRRVRINRAHLEEDAGKNMHDESGRGGESHVDLNRCGTPLLEIVSEPDLRSPEEARVYLDEMRLMLTYLGVSDCNMQEGSLRCDANVNLHIEGEGGETIATPIVEIKNLNSIRGVEMAIAHEAQRQFAEWQETGQKLGDVAKQTRGWDANRNISFAQRGKEEASDYRYFPDPDLVPATVDDELLEKIRGKMCELPANLRKRLINSYELNAYDAEVIVGQGRPLVTYYEAVASGCGDGKLAANWVTQDVLRELKERSLEIDEFPVSAELLCALLGKVKASELTRNSARTVFADLLAGWPETEPSQQRMEAIIDEKGLALVADTGELEGVVDTVLSKNGKAVADFRSGKQAAVGALIGQVMREVRGADPKAVRELLVKKMS